MAGQRIAQVIELGVLALGQPPHYEVGRQEWHRQPGMPLAGIHDATRDRSKVLDAVLGLEQRSEMKHERYLEWGQIVRPLGVAELDARRRRVSF
jgi:hypothetical protein